MKSLKLVIAPAARFMIRSHVADHGVRHGSILNAQPAAATMKTVIARAPCLPRRPRSRTSPPPSANDRDTSASGPLERATHCRPTARRQKIRGQCALLVAVPRKTLPLSVWISEISESPRGAEVDIEVWGPAVEVEGSRAYAVPVDVSMV